MILLAMRFRKLRKVTVLLGFENEMAWAALAMHA
jgi:hypothetical protein